MKSKSNLKTFGLGVCLLALATPAAAKNWYYVGGSDQWLDAASYSTTTSPSGNTEMPGSEDCILIRKGQHLTVSDSTVSFFSTVKSVYPNCEDAEIVFDLDNDATITAAVGDIGGHSYTNDWLRKKGAGKLTLGCTGTDNASGVYGVTSYAYFLNIDVQEGSVQLQGKLPGTSTTYYSMGYLNVRAGATAYLHGGVSRLKAMTGDGVISKGPETTDLQLLTAGGPDEFAGQLLISGVDFYAQRSHFLTGTDNTIGGRYKRMGYDDASWLAGNGSGNGVVGFKTLGGTRSGASSFGNHHLDEYWGAVRYIYLGTTAETVYRDMTFAFNSSGDPGVFDAGAYGGITLSDQCTISTYSTSNNGQHRLVLDGSNTVASVFGALVGRTTSPAGKTASFYITKRGTGTWKFSQPNYSYFTGVLGVENGKVEFDTIAETNKWCALGWASDLYEDKAGFPENLNKVDYAYCMGGHGGKGMLDYTGSAAVKCETRRMALQGEGGLSTSAGLVKWTDAYALGTGERALVLGGTSEAENTFSGLDERDATVSVIKEGTGSWTLTGGLDFTGDVKVKGGSLTIRNISSGAYRWFRLVLKENVNASAAYPGTTPAAGAEKDWPNNYFWLNTFALYDAEGVNRAVFPHENKDAVALAVQPSHCSDDGKIGYEATYMDTARLFVEGTAPVISGEYSRRASLRNTNYAVPTLSDPSTWMTIDLRLPDDVPEIKTFDLCSTAVGADRSYFGTAVAAYELFGSADGIRFEHLAGTNTVDWQDWSGANLWMSDGTEYTSGKRHGLALERTVSKHAFGGLASVRSLEVAADAELKLVGEAVTVNGLTISAAGAGTVRGAFSFANSGTLSVSDFDMKTRDNVVLPGSFDGATGLDNIANWSLVLNGQPVRGRSISVKDGKITISRLGFAIIVR